MKTYKQTLLIITLTILVTMSGLPPVAGEYSIALTDNLSTNPASMELRAFAEYKEQMEKILVQADNGLTYSASRTLHSLWSKAILASNLEGSASDLEILLLYTRIANVLARNLFIFESVEMVDYITVNVEKTGIEQTRLKDSALGEELFNLKGYIATTIAQVAHDVLGPLGQVSGFAELILDDKDEFSAGEIELAQNILNLTTDIRAQLDKADLGGLIKNMQSGNISEISKRKEEITITVQKIKPLAEAVAQLLEPVQGAKSDPQQQGIRMQYLEILERSMGTFMAVVQAAFSPLLIENNVKLWELKPYVDFKQFFPSPNLEPFLIGKGKALDKSKTRVEILGDVPKADLGEGDFRIILQNIINNALKYGGPTLSEIKLKVYLSQIADGSQSIIVDITNNGAPVTAENRSLHSETGRQTMYNPKVSEGYVGSDNIESYGVGLDTVWRLVTEQGGTISTKDPDQGVLIRMTLRPFIENDLVASAEQSLAAA